MAADGGGSRHDLEVQTWTMYGIGIALFLIRVYARFKTLRFKWQSDDYLMVLAIGWYTAFVVTNLRISHEGSSLFLPDQFESFTADEIHQRIVGSKIEFASEQCMLNVMYTLKACMLILYYRLTTNLRQQLFVTICAGYALCGWLASELALFLNCRPLSGYWTLPPPQQECSTYFRYLVIQAVFNISSDVAIICVVLPIIWKVRMRWRYKVPLVFIFSLGTFLIICAAVSKIFTFRDVYDSSYQFWYLREASVGIYISNLPYIWGLLRHTFSILRSTAQTSDRTSYFQASGRATASQSRSKANSVYNSKGDRVPLSLFKLEAMPGGPLPHSESERETTTVNSLEDSTSKESRKGYNGDHQDQIDSNANECRIRKTTEIVIQKHHIEGSN